MALKSREKNFLYVKYAGTLTGIVMAEIGIVVVNLYLRIGIFIVYQLHESLFTLSEAFSEVFNYKNAQIRRNLKKINIVFIHQEVQVR